MLISLSVGQVVTEKERFWFHSRFTVLTESFVLTENRNLSQIWGVSRVLFHLAKAFMNLFFFRFFLKEREIQSLSAEIESLKKSQGLGTSQRLEELQEENARLRYRLNVMNRVSSPPPVRLRWLEP